MKRSMSWRTVDIVVTAAIVVSEASDWATVVPPETRSTASPRTNSSASPRSGPANRRAPCDYQLSQRADWFDASSRRY